MKAPPDENSILARFAAGPESLAQALAGLRDADLDARPARGGWTIRQIVHHVTDGDDLWKSCIKMALGSEQGEFALAWYWAFPQDVWAERWAYAGRSLDVSMDLLKAIRAHVLQLVQAIPAGWRRAVAIKTPDGQIKQLPVGAVIEMQADHLEHHVKRILEIRRELEDTADGVE